MLGCPQVLTYLPNQGPRHIFFRLSMLDPTLICAGGNFGSPLGQRKYEHKRTKGVLNWQLFLYFCFDFSVSLSFSSHHNLSKNVKLCLFYFCLRSCKMIKFAPSQTLIQCSFSGQKTKIIYIKICCFEFITIFQTVRKQRNIYRYLPGHD